MQGGDCCRAVVKVCLILLLRNECTLDLDLLGTDPASLFLDQSLQELNIKREGGLTKVIRGPGI